MFRRSKVKSSEIVKGDTPTFLQRILGFLLLSFLLLIPMYFYFNNLGDDTLSSDYRFILSQVFVVDQDVFSGLPRLEINLFQPLISTLIHLQISLIILLVILLLISNIIRSIIKRLRGKPFSYMGAITANLMQRLVFSIFIFRSKITNDIRPYQFYTEPRVEVKSIREVISKSLWFTLIIFAAAFQFAGLFYIRTDFPEFLSPDITLLDASVIFMIVTGTIWIALLLGIDLLERFDIQILDLSTSKLTNVGATFQKLSRRGFSFLTLSFLILAIQNFQIRDWIQSVVFLNMFCLLTYWILMTYESNLGELADQVRKDLRQHTLTGAERVVTNRERKRFGKEKIAEAKKLMDEGEKRVILSEKIGFFRSIFDSIIVVLILSGFVILSNYIASLFFDQIKTLNIVLISIFSSIMFGFLMLIFQYKISQNDIIRAELLWFPLFNISATINYYITTIHTTLNETVFIVSLILFNVIWTGSVIINIYNKMPGREFWGILRQLIFSLFLIIIWIFMILQLFYMINFFTS